MNPASSPSPAGNIINFDAHGTKEKFEAVIQVYNCIYIRISVLMFCFFKKGF